MTATLACLLLATTGIMGVLAIHRFRLAELAGDAEMARQCDAERDARIDAISARLDYLTAARDALREQVAAREALDAKALADAANRAVADGLRHAVDALTRQPEPPSNA